MVLSSFQIDQKKRQIKVEGGATLDKINQILEQNDMALSVYVNYILVSCYLKVGWILSSFKG